MARVRDAGHGDTKQDGHRAVVQVVEVGNPLGQAGPREAVRSRWYGEGVVDCVTAAFPFLHRGDDLRPQGRILRHEDLRAQDFSGIPGRAVRPFLQACGHGVERLFGGNHLRPRSVPGAASGGI